MSNSDSDSDIELERSQRYPVERILRSLAPGDDDYNDWPCFLLEDATVRDKYGKPTNLLDVAIAGPLTIEGRLHFEAEDELLQSVKHQLLQSAFIRVDEVAHFSFGSRDNSADTGHVCMWGGSAKYGWFEINPSREYESTYAKSVEAVNIYYFMQALYKRKGSTLLPIEEILYNYAALEGSGRSKKNVVSAIKSHARFLLTQMNLREDVNFPKTIFYNWLASTCKDVVDVLRKQNINIPITQAITQIPSVPIPPPPLINSPHEDPEPYERPDGEIELDEDLGVLENGLEEFTVLEPSPANIAAYIAWYLEWARHYPPSKYTSTVQNLANFTARKASTMVYTELKVPKYYMSGELIRLHRLAIAKEMAKYPIWLTTPMYEELLGKRPFTCNAAAPEFVKAAREMTTISRRSALAAPRRTREEFKKPKYDRSRSPGGTVQQAHSFAPRGNKTNPGSRHESPGPLPISSRRTKPMVVLQAFSGPAFTGSKEDIRRREAATNLAKTSGEGVVSIPQGKTPARKPINISPTNVVDVGTPSRPIKRSRTDYDETNSAQRSSSPMSVSSEDDEEDEDDQEPYHLTVVSLPQLPVIDEVGYGVAESILAKETTLTGHDAPFLKQLIAEGRERLKDRETIGTKVVPNPIRGLLRGRD